MKRLFAFFCAVLCLIAGSGCRRQTTSQPQQSNRVTASTPVVTQADPGKAIAEIYKNVSIEDLYDADDTILLEKFFIDPAMLQSYEVRYASGLYGIADVFILEPYADEEEQNKAILRERLEQIKLNLAREFENYDIYNACQIIQDAVIFEQGGFMIMLMLEDNDAARKIIDQYIPK